MVVAGLAELLLELVLRQDLLGVQLRGDLRGLAADLGAGVERALEAIDSGAARELLDRLIAATARSGV